MLRVTQINSASGAKAYFKAALKTADYYQEGQEKAGIWHGKAASRLGLRGSEIEADTFGELAEGQGISQRKVANRKAGYDFTFNANKSVSLLWSLTGDDRFIEAMEDATQKAMAEVEKGMEARVRVKNQNDNRVTGNLIYGAFTHTTTRPIQGTCDPHLHQHCFVINGTFDEIEQKWKAIEAGNIMVDRPYYEALFHSYLADNIKKMGFEIEKHGKFWEIAGIDREVVEKFSRRTQEIEKRAEELGITYPEDKAKLGAMTRSRKSDNRQLTELFAEWPQRLTDKEYQKISKVLEDAENNNNSDTNHNALDTSKQLLDFQLEKDLEQNSALPTKRIKEGVLRSGIGRITPEHLEQAMKDRTDLLHGDYKGREFVTTQKVAREENYMLDFAQRGIASVMPLHSGEYSIKRDFLNEQQQGAVKHILRSFDRVSIVSGGAGTGKTTLFKEALEHIKSEVKDGSRLQVFAFAPTHGAKDVLQKDGFEANTLQKLLYDENLQKEVKDAVLWVDEAGLVDVPSMAKLFHIAEDQNARIVLSGDTNQHKSIQRGDAMRLLQEKAGIQPAHVQDIVRQSNDYKRAVNNASLGRTKEAWAGFEEMGAVREVSSDKLSQHVAADYLGEQETGRSVLVVAPTNKTRDQITGHIRQGLKQKGVLEGQEHKISTLKQVYLSEAEKTAPEALQDGQTIQFTNNAKGGIKRGLRLMVSSTDKDGHKIGCDEQGNRYIIPQDKPNFNIYDKVEKDFALGDKIKMTANGSDIDGKLLYNGSFGTIKEFTEDGHILLDNGRKISNDWGHIDHGYTSTNFAAQGSTVDVVLCAMPAQDEKALSQEGMYVAVSRGKGNNSSNIRIYTDDLKKVKQATATSSDRPGASEILAKPPEPPTAEEEQTRKRKYYQNWIAATQGLGHGDPELYRQAENLLENGGISKEKESSYDL